MIAKVLVETSHLNIDKSFDYLVPKSIEKKLKIGMRVLIPFGTRTIEGFVVDLSDTSSHNDLKAIKEIVDEEIILNKEQLELGEYISKKYLATKISSLQVMLPSALKARVSNKTNKKLTSYLKLNKEADLTKLNEKQKEIMSFLGDKILRKDELVKTFSISRVNLLINKGYLHLELIEEYRLETKEVAKKKIVATKKQAEIIKKINESKSGHFLIHGVTGSGKTLIYLETIKKVIAEGKTAIILLPEISITVALLDEFRAYFKDRVAVLHSRLSAGEKYDEYRKIIRKEVDLVLGARSAIFAPLDDIGIIVIDEEHSSTYKQENNPKYDAKDIALYRAKYHDAKLVLGSATPSLESYARSLKGIYELLELSSRPLDFKLPLIEIVDLTKEKNKRSSFSKRLSEEIIATLARGEQIIIFLNRRGYSNFSLCNNCGHVIKCPNCDISLTFHKTSQMLRCHYCGHAEKEALTCPNCHEKSMIKLGSGTQKLEEELTATFGAKVMRMDLDTTSNKGAHERLINDFKNKKADILLGTQMISKGLDFSNVTLVGIINADSSLMIPNFRASEETFQLLSQVSGRAGRSSREGKVIIQSYNADHYAIELAKLNDYKTFFKEEMKIRKTLDYPPYYYLIALKVISKDYQEASKESSRISNYLKKELSKETKVIGPSIASVFKLRNNYRFSIIIKYKYDDKLYAVLKALQNNYLNSKVSIDIEFNPWYI